MPRNRMIRPEFWSDEKVGTLSFLQRLLFIGMWNFADDEGIIKGSPLFLKAMIFPYDNLEEKEIPEAIKSLLDEGCIFCYRQNGEQFIWIIKFRVHQRIDKPQKSNNPGPSIQNSDYHHAIFKRDNHVCHLCGKITEIGNDSNSKNFPSVDHLTPRSKGGDHYPSNLKTACSSCNKSRRNKDIGAFKEHSKNGLGMVGDEDKRKEVKEKVSKRDRERESTTPQAVGPSVSDFEKFWSEYPKKVGKLDAQKAWKKNSSPGIDKILEAISQQRASPQWTKDGGKFIPNPATWINGGRWDDQPQKIIDEVEAWEQRQNSRE